MKPRASSPAFRPVMVLRFHDQFAVVRQRAALLRMLNPTVPLYAVYGGSVPLPKEMPALFDGLCQLSLSPVLAWRNVDLALLEWYRAEGRASDFTHVYVLEWDLVYVAPITTALPIPQSGQSLLSGYIPLSEVEWKWDWTNGKKLGSLNEWLELKRFVAKNYHYIGPYFACIGPGAVLSREFLEFYHDLELPLLCHDELRMPLVHAIGKLPVGDTGLYPTSWYLPEHEDWVRRFNVRRWEVEPRAVVAGERAGHMAFHPVYKLLDQRLLRRLSARYNKRVSAPPVTGS